MEPHYMNRVNRIINNHLFQECLSEINKLEKSRIFCCHSIDHFMDTARIMYIYALEHNLCINKELIYTTALLHDIGRAEQYKSGINHRIAGVEIAADILMQCDYSSDEIDQITEAIKYHKSDSRNDIGSEISGLRELLLYADNKSRLCIFCNASDECYWSPERKNMTICI